MIKPIQRSTDPKNVNGFRECAVCLLRRFFHPSIRPSMGRPTSKDTGRYKYKMFETPSLRLAASPPPRRISLMLFVAVIFYYLTRIYTLHRGLALQADADLYEQYEQHHQQQPQHHYVVEQQNGRQRDASSDLKTDDRIDRNSTTTGSSSNNQEDRIISSNNNSIKDDVDAIIIIQNYNSNNKEKIPLLARTSTDDDDDDDNINQKKLLPVRIVTFQGAPPMKNFLFRQPPDKDNSTADANGGNSITTRPWYTRLSDEMLNICLDGMKKSSYFQVLEPMVVPYRKFDAKSVTLVSNNKRKTRGKEKEPFVIQETEPVVWMIDVRSLQLFPDIDYVNDPVLQLVYNTRKWQQQQQDLKNDGHYNHHHHHPIHIVFMDWRDRMGTSLCKSETEGNVRDEDGRKLKAIEQIRYLLGPQSIVRQVRQQLVYKRVWNETTNFVDFGHVMDDYIDHYDKCFNSSIPSFEKKKDDLLQQTISNYSLSSDRILEYFASNIHYHIPYTVRSDFVESVQRYMRTRTPPSTTTTTDVTDKSNHITSQQKYTVLLPPDIHRPIDVVHLFNATSTEDRAELRKAVSTALLELIHTENQTTNHHHSDDHRGEAAAAAAAANNNITVIASAVSESGANGRVNVQERYLNILMSSKIVVVAQRDTWEDHYRLFEAITSGALVMTDFMWTLPQGYVDGVNIVVYKSIDELKDKVLYYLDPHNERERLTMARAGWELAVTQHRTFHWMERLFFGYPMTNTALEYDDWSQNQVDWS